jgi:hypothetical protein
MSIVNAGTQNQLAQMQISAAQRAAQEDQDLKNYLADNPDLTTAEGQRGAMKFGKAGQALVKTFVDQAKDRAQTNLYGAQAEDLKYKAETQRLENALKEISNFPDAPSALASIDTQVSRKIISPEQATQLKAQINAAPDFATWQRRTVTGMMAAKDRLDILEENRYQEFRGQPAPAVVPTAPINDTKASLVRPTQASVPLDKLNVSQDASGNKTYYLDGVPIPEEKFAELFAASAAPVPLSGTRAAGLAPMVPTPAPMAPAAAVAPMAPAATAAPAAAAAAPPEMANALALKIQGLQDQRNQLEPFLRSSSAKLKYEDLGKQIDKLKSTKTQRYLSLGAGAALDTESGLIIAKDKIPEVVAAPKIISIKGIPHTLNAEGELVPVPVEGGAPAVAVKPQAVAATRIINIKGVPHTLNAEGNLAPLTVEGGALPAPAAAAVAATPKIINIKGIPHTLNAEGKLVRIPIEGGALPVAGKVGTGKTAAVGAVKKPNPPVGYRYDASGVNLEVIPGGPADKEKPLTETQGNATAFGMRMQQAHDLLISLEKSGATDTGIARGVIGGTLALTPLIGDKLDDATGNIFNALPRVLGGLNDQQQKTVNSRINFITAVLRKESGAVIGPDEFRTAEKLYFPQPGNPPSVIAQKQRTRELAIQAMKVQAGPGAKNIGAEQRQNVMDESDPLGIRKK